VRPPGWEISQYDLPIKLPAGQIEGHDSAAHWDAPQVYTDTEQAALSCFRRSGYIRFWERILHKLVLTRRAYRMKAGHRIGLKKANRTKASGHLHREYQAFMQASASTRSQLRTDCWELIRNEEEHSNMVPVKNWL
jgi:hypothetical protein